MTESAEAAASNAEADRQGLQKINVKFLLEEDGEVDYDFLLVIFGRWREDEGEEIIDLADYLHVPHGPGCLLVSHRWHFGVDFSNGRPGLFFSSRKGLEGELPDRLRTAIRACLEKGKRLLSESEVPAGLKPRLGDVEVVINDRVLLPNTEESDAEVRPALETVLDRLYGTGAWTIERDDDPQRRLAYRARARDGRELGFDELLGRLG